MFAAKNAVAIGDWWHLRNYEPSEQVAQIATDAGMSEEGRRLFYRMDPQLISQQELNQQCSSDVLGCTVGINIYILRDFTPQQHNRTVVTAAHEMLHVSYSRLANNELDSLETALDEQIDLISGDLYDKFDHFTGDDFYNEAHSYIGTEAAELTDELETHYSEYFDDRSKTLKALRFSPEN